MGIELPAELRDVAARAGARWPEADEDAMRASAVAWRDAAKSVESLSRSADGSAQGALSAIDGETAQAARKKWDGFAGSGSGRFPASVQECTAAADRLDHAADQIGAAKVAMVRELVSLAKTTDAAHQLAATGNAQALAGVDTVVRGASANLAQVHNSLATAVDKSSGGTMEHGSSGGLPGPVGTVTGAAAHTLGPATESTANTVHSTVDAAGNGAVAVGDLAAKPTGGLTGENPPVTASPVAEVTGEAARHVPAAAGSEAWKAANEHTGPVSARTITDAGTGPIPVAHGPQSVQQAWAASPPPSAPPPGVAPAAPQQGYAQPQYQAGQFAPPPPAAAPGGGQAAGQAAGRPPAASAPPVTRQPAAGGYAAPAAQQPQAQPRPQAPARPGGAVVPPPPAAKPQAPPPQQPVRQAPPPVQAQPQAEVPQRPLKQADRSGAVVAFVLHQFPIGHMPVAASRPHRQLPPPPPEADPAAGLRFPPQDHPQSPLVDDAGALGRVCSGELYRAAAELRRSREESPGLPDELIASYQPLGELSEAEWERWYVASTDGQRQEFAWRAGEQFPEGCVESGEPIVLDPGAVLDRCGDDDGRVLAPAGTAFAQRALPPAAAEAPYRRYRVQKRLPVWQGINAPWFAQSGGGVRYRATYSVSDLVALGYLVELTPELEAAEAPTMRLTVDQVQPEQETGK